MFEDLQRTFGPSNVLLFERCSTQRRQITPLVWTNEDELMTGSVEGDSQGASLDNLYAWWKNAGIDIAPAD